MQIEDLLERLDIPFRRGGEHQHVTAGWIGLDCPRCSPDSQKFKLGYNPTSGWCTCWTCGGSSIRQVLLDRTKLSYRELDGLLQEVLPGRILERVRTGLVIPPGVGPLLEPHRRYLESRHLDGEVLEKHWGVRGIGRGGRLAWRIWIPLRERNRILSWTTRTIGNREPRYITARPTEEAMNSKHLLLGEHLVKHSIVVTEGPFDAMRIGFGAVATLGVSFSKEQVLRISKYPLRAICFDNERNAQKRARDLCDRLAGLPGKTICIVLDAEDPASATDREIRLLRKECFDE